MANTKFELEAEYAHFLKNLPEWLKTHEGEWVVIKGEETNFYPDRDQAFLGSQTLYGNGGCFLVDQIKPQTIARATTIRSY